MELKDYLELTAIIIAMISTFIAAYAAKQSKNVTKISLASMVSQLLLAQREKYSSDKMKRSLRLLVEYYKRDPENFADKFKKKQKQEVELDEARRYVKFYFIENFDLLKTELFSENQMKILMHNGNVSILLQIIKPMELNTNKVNRDEEMFSYYENKFLSALKEKI